MNEGAIGTNRIELQKVKSKFWNFRL